MNNKLETIDYLSLLTVEEVASLLRVSEDTVRSMAREGNIPSIKIGRFWRFPEKHIHEWLARKLIKETMKIDHTK